jgi:hypothetical protein
MGRAKLSQNAGQWWDSLDFRVPYEQEIPKRAESSLNLQGNPCNSNKLERSDHVCCRHVCVPSGDTDQSAITSPRNWGH